MPRSMRSAGAIRVDGMFRRTDLRGGLPGVAVLRGVLPRRWYWWALLVVLVPAACLCVVMGDYVVSR